MSAHIHSAASPLRDVLVAAGRIAASDAPVLIAGETGSGKDLLARLVHAGSARAAGPLVPVHCGAIPETLLEGELFGRAGPVARAGRLQQARGGTLLLEQVSAMPPTVQARLVRALQERAFEAVGGVTPIEADFRLIATTDHDLAADVEAGRFRKDLYYRLLVCELRVPPLRERTCDLPLLLQHFLERRGERRGAEPALLQALMSWPWPGNVRELQNLAERLAVCATGPVLTLADLPESMRPSGPPPAKEQPRQPMPFGAAAIALPVDLPAMLQQLERSHIEAALVLADGNKTVAAELLGLQRTTLVEKLRRKAKEADAELPAI